MAEVAPEFETHLSERGLPRLRRSVPSVLQVNVGKLCNQACHHCHVEAGPGRREQMEARTAEQVLTVLRGSPSLACVDLTGGAPELNAHFRALVRGARAVGRRVIDRCNLTVLFERGQEDTAEFLAEQEVEVIASLPCYTRANVEAQRGRGVFDKSIEALRRLNALGYGDGPRTLHLVYNPAGAVLPPDQASLEATYRKELDELFGIRFDHLLTLANMPIKRFAHSLARQGQHEAYLSMLVAHFNPETLPGLMCRDTVSVGYDGALYDCDFNQMLDIPLAGSPRTIFDLEDVAELAELPIASDRHCFGCTAGSGSSCGGALAE